MIRSALLLALGIALGRDSIPAQIPAQQGARVVNSEQWKDEIAQFRAADKLHPPRAGGVVFVGSSSIRLWPHLQSDFPGINLLQRGVGGSQLPDIVYWAPQIVLPYRPHLIVLYAGDNDIAEGATPENVFSDYKAFVQLVRKSLPRARIAFVAIKPSIARASMIEKARAANRLIQQYAAAHPRLLYVDVFTPMLNARGQPRPELFVEDGLHLSARGYALWRDLLAPIVQKYSVEPTSERGYAVR